MLLLFAHWRSSVVVHQLESVARSIVPHCLKMEWRLRPGLSFDYLPLLLIPFGCTALVASSIHLRLLGMQFVQISNSGQSVLAGNDITGFAWGC